MRANKAIFLAPKAAFRLFQSKQLMGLPLGIADHEDRTGTSTVAQVDKEEKSPSWFRNPCLRPPELIAPHFAGLHKAQPLQDSDIYLRGWIRRSGTGRYRRGIRHKSLFKGGANSKCAFLHVVMRSLHFVDKRI